jgi:stringent starvation protein B
MPDAPRQPPPKKEVALALLEVSSMFIHLDPRRPEVLVPKGFMGQPQLVLQVGLNMAIPIHDLKIDDDGVSCTLSFNRTPFWCRIPWTAVYALVGEDGRGGVWAEDVPPEIQQQKQAAAAKTPAAKKPRPKLTAVSSTPEAKSDAPDELDEQASPAIDGSGARDLRAQEGPPEPARLAALTAVPMEPPTPAPPKTTATPRQPAPPAQGAKKPKREIPPYLRVIK